MSDHRVAPAWRRIHVVAVLAVLALAFVGRAGAATGDTLRTISADQSGTACVGGGIGVGLAFDGTNLLVSCYFDSTVVAVSPVNGAQMIGGVHAIVGASSLGALAWDSGRNVLWACSGFSTIGTIDLSTNVFTAAFGSADCFDGLAYDASDDTLWASPDASMPINHYSVTGTLLGSFTTSLGGYGNSGIAVGLFQDATVLVMDGYGDDSATSVYTGAGTRLERHWYTGIFNSIGMVYTFVTHYLGFGGFADEGKVMALAAYGGPTYVERFRKLSLSPPRPSGDSVDTPRPDQADDDGGDTAPEEDAGDLEVDDCEDRGDARIEDPISGKRDEHDLDPAADPARVADDPARRVTGLCCEAA